MHYSMMTELRIENQKKEEEKEKRRKGSKGTGREERKMGDFCFYFIFWRLLRFEGGS